jgi:hypothetical protein
MDKLTLRDNDATANAIIFHHLFDFMLEQRAQSNTLISIEMLRNEKIKKKHLFSLEKPWSDGCCMHCS